VDMWNKTKLMQEFIGTQAGRTVADQYLPFAAWLRSGIAVTVLAVFAGASYPLTLLVQLFTWPSWVTRLSVFGAFGRPYLELPTAAGFAMLGALALLGTLLAAAIASRSPTVASTAPGNRSWSRALIDPCQRAGPCQRAAAVSNSHAERLRGVSRRRACGGCCRGGGMRTAGSSSSRAGR
jgi:hypothetical protein